ncbi:MAG: MBL fold metallo-hydrolase [Ardenticatenaceae bacterium]|nr:MBL fold metallo-hydrolase [Ardenticatenaceae bacterium]
MSEQKLNGNGRAPQSITYVGHATVLIQMDGVRLLTDPILRGRVAHLSHRTRRIEPTYFENIDAVLISHLHWDHLDWPSLRRLGHNTRILAPRGSAAYFAGRGFKNVEELQNGEETRVGGVAVRATQAVHDGRRYPKGPFADPVGYLVNSHHSIYFAGDTDLFPAMSHLADNLDVALLPVWGWGPTLGTGHLTPDRAAQALTMLRPQIAIPIHWGALHPIGMGMLKPAFLTQPPVAFARHAARLAPEVNTCILPIGNTLSLNGVNGADNGAQAG